MKSQEFSIMSRIKSFRFALEGIVSFFKHEHNAWLHFIATVAVFALTWWVGVDKNELLALVFAVGFVWVAEMFNTCIERVMDFVTEKRHPEIKFIKDVASGAVLVAALTALAVGAVIFIPKLF
ncbi:MAG TPA: diacylglycerol kinase family protein [Niastella sp.]